MFKILDWEIKAGNEEIVLYKNESSVIAVFNQKIIAVFSITDKQLPRIDSFGSVFAIDVETKTIWIETLNNQ